MYEVEIKVELTDMERQNLLKFFMDKGFISKGVTPQSDFYIEAKESPYGGNDLKRYRKEGNKFIYTEKVWEDVGGQPARKENEKEVSESEFKSEVAKYSSALKIQKDREWFEGSCSGSDISITVDTVKFDHSLSVRYFIEAEIDVKNKKDVPQTKDLIREFLKSILGKSEIIESPGMFTMAFQKK